MEDARVCEKCVIKEVVKIQGSRRYDHGRITGRIPPHSHLFESEWYEKGVELWGPPSVEDMECAQQHQRIARETDTSKVLPPPSSIAMPRPRKKAIAEAAVEEKEEAKEPVEVKEPVKRRRPRMTKVPITPMEPVPSTQPVSESAAVLALFFPKEATELPNSSTAATSAAEPAPTEKRRKPRVAKKKEQASQEPEQEPQEPQEPQEEKKEEKKEEKPKKPRAKRATKASKAEPAPSLPTHQDSCIPTHIEQTMEPHRLDDYEVEYVPLTIFIYDNVVYFRDARKNKLYRRVKEKTAGSYVGRYDMATDAILTDIPDSDEED